MNIANMMKQAKEMQAKMEKMQADLDQMIAEGVAGGGMVTIKVSGKGEMKGISISPECMAEDDREMLEDLIVAAYNDAKAKIDKKSAEEMQKVTGGLNLPAGMKLPF